MTPRFPLETSTTMIIAMSGTWGYLLSIVTQIPDTVPLAMIGGIAGGICRILALWITDAEPLSWKSFGIVVISTISAGFIWVMMQPLAENVLGRFQMEPITAVLFGGFIVGLLGLTLIVGIIEIFPKQLRNSIARRAALLPPVPRPPVDSAKDRVDDE